MVALCVLGALFCILQLSILRNIAIFQVTPDIVLVLVIYAALFHGRAGMWLGFVTGLFIDLYSPVLGYNALMGTIIGYGIGVLSSRIYKEIPILWVIILFGCSLLHGVVTFAAEHELSLYFFMRYILSGAFYTTVVGMIIFYILRRTRIS